MKIEKINHYNPHDNQMVTVKICGNIIEVRCMEHQPRIKIQKLDANTYLDIPSGEVKDFTKTAYRTDSPASIRQSMKNLRDLINTNITYPENCRFITLTYAENMQSQKQLYKDFSQFNKRLHYHYGNYEYIAVAEPQGRGAWHLHVILIFPDTAPFMDNQEVQKIWRHGYTSTRALDENIDNIGLYLSAYLADIPVNEYLLAGYTKAKNVHTIQKNDETGKTSSKQIVKGGRLHFYPKGFRFFRCSKGIKNPTLIQTTQAKAMEIVKDIPLAYEKTIQLLQDDKVVNTINYRTFNRNRKE